MSVEITFVLDSDQRIKIGSAGTVGVDLSSFGEDALAHIFLYGLRQNLNDARASETDSAKALALVEKRLDALYSGEFRASAGREVDPVAAEVKRLAEAAVRKAIRASGKKIKDYEDQIPALVKAYVAKNPSVQDVARANVAARGKADSVSLEELLA